MAEEAPQISYEDLAVIEDEFEQIDTEIMRKQYELSASTFAKRNAAIAKIPNFWALVMEQAPLEIDQFINPQDSRIINDSLINIEISRPELDNHGSGEPRSIHFKFTFQPNEDFEDTVLEKTFWYRRARDGWVGLVSEPVRINWKKGKDPTQGLTDMSVALFEARTKLGDMTARGMPEYTALKKKVESWNGMNTSFFTWFAYVSGRRYVTAEESVNANEKNKAEKEDLKAGKKVDVEAESARKQELEQEELGLDDELVEVHEAGEEIAIALAEDLWPNAIKLFTQAQDMEEMSDGEFEDDDMDFGPDDVDDDVDGEAVDIRALVGDKDTKSRSKGSDESPNKKRKT